MVRLGRRYGPPRFRVVDRQEFNRLLDAQIVSSPKNVAGIGWSAKDAEWLATGDRLAVESVRLPPVVRHLHRALAPRHDSQSFWLFCCTYDGWRERTEYRSTYEWVEPPTGLDEQVEWSGGPGAIPILSPHRDWVACFAAHRGDPSARLLPEAHYLSRAGYRRLKLQLRTERRPWQLRRDRAAYAGADHDAPSPHTAGPVLRRQLLAMVERDRLPVDAALNRAVSRRSQLRHKYLIDIDGFVRTWDAWAWKMLSGSVVLSPATIWETRFTRAFEPWQHFVPVAADLSDLAERLDWCRANDEKCRAIATRSRRRALEVYNRRRVERQTAEIFAAELGLAPPVGGA